MRILEFKTFEEIRSILYECKGDVFTKSLLQNEILDNLAQKYHNYGTVFGLIDKRQIVGFIAFYANDVVNRIAYISMIVIKKVYQGQGFASILLDKAIDRSVSKDMCQIKLEVNKENINAIKFYYKHGFEKFNYSSEVSLFMVKPLLNQL